MKIAGRRLNQWLPRSLRPLARRAGLELRRLRLGFRDAAFRIRLAAGGGVEHLHGTGDVVAGAGELVVVSVIRNAAAHLPTFIPYYQRLGAKHIVLVDTGSTDETVELARGYDRVTIYRTGLSFARYSNAIKRWLVRRFAGPGGWALVADMDELFEYPFASQLPLSGFLEYLEHHEYDAVVAQMLDMVPQEPLRQLQYRVARPLEETHRYYDTSDIQRVSDSLWLRYNWIDSKGLFSHTGGIGDTVFGYQGSMLTKQVLVRPGVLRVFPYNVHFVTRARIADVTAVLRHYKYTGRFVAGVAEEIERKQYYGGAEIYHYYRRALESDPDLSLHRSTAVEYAGADALLEDGFLVASERYRDWVRRASHHSTAR